MLCGLGFEVLAESLPHAVWVKGADGATEYVNTRYTDFVGQEAERAHGWSWLELLHPDDVVAARSAWEEALAGETAYQADLRLSCASGGYRWVASRGAPVRGEGGTVIGWLGTITDIDDQKRVEQHLRQSQRELAASVALLDALQSAAPVGLAFVDREFRKLRINQAWPGSAPSPSRTRSVARQPS